MNQSIDVPEGGGARLKANKIELELDDIVQAEQRIKLYQKMNFAQKLNVWLVVICTSITIFSNTMIMVSQATSQCGAYLNNTSRV